MEILNQQQQAPVSIDAELMEQDGFSLASYKRMKHIVFSTPTLPRKRGYPESFGTIFGKAMKTLTRGTTIIPPPWDRGIVTPFYGTTTTAAASTVPPLPIPLPWPPGYAVDRDRGYNGEYKRV
ncbi:hypothetical protein FQR65_LT04731 [Abscondita terminalis]|nr:hypothetical protein FQR65_LT04731 [Abscondita terminalis]